MSGMASAALGGGISAAAASRTYGASRHLIALSGIAAQWRIGIIGGSAR